MFHQHFRLQRNADSTYSICPSASATYPGHPPKIHVILRTSTGGVPLSRDFSLQVVAYFQTLDVDARPKGGSLAPTRRRDESAGTGFSVASFRLFLRRALGRCSLEGRPTGDWGWMVFREIAWVRGTFWLFLIFFGGHHWPFDVFGGQKKRSQHFG